jgi:LmbE family N-acetylglucosaminyl deacetylase
MKFHLETAEIYVPDNLPVDEALARTTHLAVSAHQDDIEIMAAGPIIECFQQDDKWFTGVVVSDGRGSPRAGIYERYDDEQMRLVRFKEQCKAAMVGEYAAQIMLDYPSKFIKDGNNKSTVEDLAAILNATHPTVVYTHNLADKHDTHVSVVLRVIEAIRSLPAAERPHKLYGCEVWRDLDWMVDKDKVAFNLSNQENLQAALLGV